MKKLPNSKSIEELLKDLDNPNESTEKIQIEEDSILTFLSFYNIEPGKEKIRDGLFYKLYKQFTKNPKTTKSFHLAMGQYLPTEIQFNHLKFYLINQKVLNLSKRALDYLNKNDQTPKRRVTSWRFHFDNFVKRFDIISGGSENYIWVSTSILYNLYDQWTYQTKKTNRLSIKEFRKLAQVYLEYKEDNQSIWFKVKNSILKHLSREMDEKLQARNSLSNEKEKKQKKQRKKSGPKT